MAQVDSKKTSIFWKVFWGVLLIAIFSNIVFAYIIYNAYEGIMVQVRPFLSPEFFSSIEVSINSTWLIAASSFLFVIVMAILFTVLFTGRILKPLKQLLDIVQEVGKGNLDVKAGIKVRDEIGDLANEFNLMIDKLKTAREAIQEEKNILEIKVRARTNELQELAQSLDEKVKERTKELQERIEELERFHRLTVGRELKMLELKKENEKLRDKEKQ
ncbi:MAG: HAMP domain-containing protein [Candidatus Paceibacterota bacterium]|jgi:methyl-accepting chemotaxis protein